MLRFNNDYNEGAHESILKKLAEINMNQIGGYGEDEYCDEARDIIKKLCDAPSADVHFLVGGTQTNLTVIAAALRPYQCAVCASTGHINVHETGAIEATGHKVFAVPSDNGKLTAKMIEEVYNKHWSDDAHEHIAQPKLVYISESTEIGTIYTKKELEEIYAVCKKCGMYLFIDGARLAYALASEKNDLDFKTIAANCDVFYIGGTKVGAFCGEAVVIPKKGLIPKFFTTIKQHGALLAKGRLIGIQFDTLFTDHLYLDISRHAIVKAEKLKKALLEKGYTLYLDSPTNQQFVLMENRKKNELLEKVDFDFFENYDDTHTVMRFVTSWATREEDLDRLIEIL